MEYNIGTSVGVAGIASIFFQMAIKPILLKKVGDEWLGLVSLVLLSCVVSLFAFLGGLVSGEPWVRIAVEAFVIAVSTYEVSKAVGKAAAGQ